MKNRLRLYSLIFGIGVLMLSVCISVFAGLFFLMPLFPPKDTCVNKDGKIVGDSICYQESERLMKINKTESSNYFWCSYRKPKIYYSPRIGEQLDCLFKIEPVKRRVDRDGGMILFTPDGLIIFSP